MEPDVVSLVKQYDPGGMYDLIFNLYKDLEKAYKLYAGFKPSKQVKVTSVVIAGLGGSAIGGDIIKEYLFDKMPVPIEVCRDFSIPGYVNSSTLVIAVSYSGNTEETLRSFISALKRRAEIVAVSSDGILEQLASSKGVPLLKLPTGRPPRTAVGYMVVALLAILDGYGVVQFPEAELREAIQVLSKLSNEYRELAPDSEPVKIARSIADKIPLIYAHRPYSAVGFRFKTQINENAKMHAFFAQMPEANHNEIMGFEKLNMDNAYAILVRGKREQPYVKARIEYWEKMLSEVGVPYMEVRGVGESLLSEMLSLMFKLDVASYVLSVLRRVDPMPVATISRLKEYVNARLSIKEEIERLASSL